ncbi:MAG: hypothetical protein ACL7BU_06505 [Candidatus Phlomobacter fragariae]
MTELLNEIVKLLSYNYYTDNQVITLFNYLIQEDRKVMWSNQRN